jgi:hypothetical protein
MRKPEMMSIDDCEYAEKCPINMLGLMKCSEAFDIHLCKKMDPTVTYNEWDEGEPDAT